MTVSYQYEVASSTSGGFTRLLFMWKGSLYKLIYRELFLFLLAFGVLSALYRNVFTPEQRRVFERIAAYCDAVINMIPLSFVLGFYVAYIATRWWSQYLAIPWPDKIMHSLALYVGGTDEQSRILRRTLMRYLNLSLVLVLRSISSAVKRRFPTLEHLVEAGFMTPHELDMFTSVPNMEFNTYWIPCTWFINLIRDAKKNKVITDPQGLKFVMEEFSDFRSKCGLLWSYDWISIPLVYTQVVTIATYSFFIIAVLGRQYLDSNPKVHQIEIDIYVPVFTILQFLFFMGLLKVAEQLINPFGDDDEDFELNWLIDRHTKVSYLGVDSLTIKSPPLVKDKYFNDANLTLPYTGAAFAYKKKTYRGSVHNMQGNWDSTDLKMYEEKVRIHDTHRLTREYDTENCERAKILPGENKHWPTCHSSIKNGVPEEQQTMFLPEIIEEEDEPQQRTPKNSFPNLFVNTPSPSAGIWRQSVCSTDGDRMSTAEEGVSVASTPEVKESKMMKFLFPAKKVSPKLEPKDKCFSSSELKQWSSNSTIDSYCSTLGALDSSVDLQAHTVHGRPRSNSSIRDLRRASGCGTGAWRGVRWKPVLDDSCGDVWSDNKSLRASASSTIFPLRPKGQPDDAPPLPPRRNTSPTTDIQIPSILLTAVEQPLNKAAAASLPNLNQPEDTIRPIKPGGKNGYRDRQPKSL